MRCTIRYDTVDTFRFTNDPSLASCRSETFKYAVLDTPLDRTQAGAAMDGAEGFVATADDGEAKALTECNPMGRMVCPESRPTLIESKPAGL